MAADALLVVLASVRPSGPGEARALARLEALARGGDPWARSRPLHATASALVVDERGGRVLLRYHERLGQLAQVGGHAEAGEDDPYAVARREALEETGLADLVAWPEPGAPRPVQVQVVPARAHADERAHEHADVRYLLATALPDTSRPERPGAALVWLPFDRAAAAVSDPGLRRLVRLAARLAASRREARAERPARA
ncbi:MAG TPA: NUDIX domain-containing protein [Acidimicrobiales bacterium]|nr:NUDIX domain-containing protein [Acidimicrobiales bacterium]